MKLEDCAETAIDDWDFFLPRNHKDKPIKNQRYRIFEPQCKQIIMLWFGRKDLPKEEKEAFIQALTNFHDGCLVNFGDGRLKKFLMNNKSNKLKNG